MVEIMQNEAPRASLVTSNRAEKCQVRAPAKFKVGDLVVVVRDPDLGSAIKWPSFCSQNYGPCRVLKSNNP